MNRVADILFQGTSDGLAYLGILALSSKLKSEKNLLMSHYSTKIAFVELDPENYTHIDIWKYVSRSEIQRVFYWNTELAQEIVK